MPFATSVVQGCPARLQLLALAAIALPLLWPGTSVPDAVHEHQLLAWAGWGALLLGLQYSRLAAGTGMWALLLAMGVLAAAAVLGLRSDLAAAGLLVAGAAVASAGARAEPVAVRAVALSWWFAGVASAAVAVLQYALPAIDVGGLVAETTTAGRAVGNMRQPNHLATALVCALLWTAWAWSTGLLRGSWAAASMAGMVLALAMSASRTGALSLAVPLAWGLLGRRLPRAPRVALVLLPLGYLMCWAVLTVLAEKGGSPYFGAVRLAAEGDPSSSRLAIWHNALSLVAEHPWTGVGWGGFNFAWTFTPFPDRPIALFDHAHNAPLQLAVELGLPVAAAVITALTWAVWRAVQSCWSCVDGERATILQASCAMLAVLGVHSLLEYPLWYANFLLPTAWVFGVALRGADSAGAPAARRPLRLAGALMIMAAAYAVWDHRRIEAIFDAEHGATPLAERIARGRESLLFGHHADYAAVTAGRTETRLDSFRRPLLQLVDMRLLIAYIEALEAAGRDDEARYATQRLREFRRPEAQAFFAACADADPTLTPRCDAGPVPLTWRDLLP